MEARVIKPAQPLPEFPLVVKQLDTCLPLRPAKGGQNGCLPAGTRLAAVRPQHGESGLGWFDESWWPWVKTETGETGRISLTGSPITRAVP